MSAAIRCGHACRLKEGRRQEFRARADEPERGPGQGMSCRRGTRRAGEAGNDVWIQGQALWNPPCGELRTGGRGSGLRARPRRARPETRRSAAQPARDQPPSPTSSTRPSPPRLEGGGGVGRGNGGAWQESGLEGDFSGQRAVRPPPRRVGRVTLPGPLSVPKALWAFDGTRGRGRCAVDSFAGTGPPRQQHGVRLPRRRRSGRWRVVLRIVETFGCTTSHSGRWGQRKAKRINDRLVMVTVGSSPSGECRFTLQTCHYRS